MPVFAIVEPRRGLFGCFPPATRAELFGGLLFLFLSLLGTAWVIKCRSAALALEGDAAIVDGTVVRLWITTGKGSGVHHVAYEYALPPLPAAHSFHGETRLSDEQFARLRQGGPIAVRMCRSDPANHRLAIEAAPVLASTAALAFSLALLAVLALAGGINLWWWWVCRGKPASAQLIIFGTETEL
jgi:hypothetical protein